MVILKKLYHILLGNIRNLLGIKPPYYKERLEICNRCLHNKYERMFGHYCDICGCLIKSKISVKDEYCKMQKW